MRVFILYCFLLYTPSLFSQMFKKSTFNETSAYHLGRKLDSISIIITGPTATRIFLEEIASRLTKQLKLNKVIATHLYLGKEPELLDHFLNSVTNTSSNVIMVFIPTQDAALYTQTHKGANLILFTDAIFASPASKNVLNYKAEFVVALYEKNHTTSFWSGLLKVHLDPGKKAATKRVSNWIFFCFKKNRYV